MGICSTEAVILKTFPLGDSDKIAVAYSRDYGKVRGVAQGAHRLRSPLAGRLEPFNWVEIVFFEKEGKDLVSINKVELLRAFGSNLRDYRCFLQLNFLAELLIETTPDREPNDPLFRLLLLTMEEIQTPGRSDLAQLYFEVWHLKISGFFPSARFCSQCRLPMIGARAVCYLPDVQGFRCADCSGRGAQPISAGSYQVLNQILGKSLKDVELPPEDGLDFSDLERVVEEMIRHNFDRSFKTLSLLREEPSRN